MPDICQLLVPDLKQSITCTAPREMRFFSYTPFGYINTPSHNGCRFNGQYLEPLTNRYLLGNGYRAYSPVLSRFASPDDFSPFGAGGLNAYIYCAGDPINGSDPSGHASSFFTGKFQRFFNKNKPVGDILKRAGGQYNLSGNIKSNRLVRTKLLENSNFESRMIELGADSKIIESTQVFADRGQFDIVANQIKGYNKANAFKNILAKQPQGKPALLTASDVALGTVPDIDQSIGRDFMRRALDLGDADIPVDAHKRIRELLQGHVKKTSRRGVDIAWLKQSKALNKTLRKS